MSRQARARIGDLHAAATRLPDVTWEGELPRVTYQVGGKAFASFRGPRKDAVDAAGQLLPDVWVIWTPDLGAKEALVQDPASPCFTTSHFNGYRAVLLRESEIGQLSRAELGELIEDAWLARAPKRLAASWLSDRHELG